MRDGNGSYYVRGDDVEDDMHDMNYECLDCIPSYASCVLIPLPWYQELTDFQITGQNAGLPRPFHPMLSFNVVLAQ